MIGCAPRSNAGSLELKPVGRFRNRKLITAIFDDQLEIENLGLLPFGLTPRVTRTRLVRPVGHGIVLEIGTGPDDSKRRYVLSERGHA